VCSIVFQTEHWQGIGPESVQEVQHQAPPARFFGLLG
jgi:hypothetical protein